MANKYMKRHLTLWSLGEVNQNHSAVHYMPLEWLTVKTKTKADNTKC